MPFNIEPGQRALAITQPYEPERPSTLGEQFGAAVDLDNVTLGAYRLIGDMATSYDDEEDFDPLSLVTESDAAFAPLLVRARSRREFDDIKTRIDREENARAALDDGPWNPLLVSIISAFVDPVSYVPFFGQLTKAAQGASIGARVATGGAVVAAEVAVGEAVLQAQQETRTADETLAAILVGGVFGAGLTGAGIALNRGTRQSVSDATSELAEISRIATEMNTDLSAGAALSGREAVIPGELTRPVAERAVKILRKVTQLGSSQAIFTSPALELAASPFSVVRSFLHKMTDTGVMTKGKALGISLAPGGAWVQRADRWKGIAKQSSDVIRSAYNQARSTGFSGNYSEFKRELNEALNVGDASKIAEVEAAAKTLRKEVFNPVGEQLKKEGLIQDLLFGGSDPANNQSWFFRSWSKRKIAAEPNGFEAELNAYFRDAIVKHNAKIAQVDTEIETGVTSPRDRDRALGSSMGQDVLDPDIDAAEFAKQVRQQILGTIRERNIPIQVKLRGSEKPRGLHVPYALAKRWINDDAEALTHGYLRTVGSDLEAMRIFGSLNIEDTLAWKQLAEEIDAKAAAAKGKEAEKITARGKREQEVLQALWGRIRGADVDASWSPDLLRGPQAVLRVGSFVTKLGGVVVSSLPDVGRVAMTEGFYRTNKALIGGMIDGFKGIRLTKKEANLIGGALQSFDNSRAVAAFDIGDPWATRSATERGANVVGSIFSKSTLLPYWTDGWQSAHGFVATKRIFDIAKQVEASGGDLSKLSKFDLRKLADDNLTPMRRVMKNGEEVFEPDPGILLAIAKQSDKWEEVGGGYAANVGNWTDRVAADAYRAALFREMETGVYNVGPADRPLWSSSPALGGLGRTISQFKSYGMASATRITTAMIQEGANGEYAAVMGRLSYMIALGMAATAAWDLMRDGKVSETRNARQWVRDGVDRSGVLALYTELEGALQSMNIPPLSQFATGQQLSRFRSRGPVAQVAGPAIGLGEQLSRAVYGATRGEFTESDMHGIRNLIPWQNHFIVGQGFNMAEKALARGYNLKPRE